MDLELAVVNGDVVFPWGVRSGLNIGMAEGKIVRLTSEPIDAQRVLDATGQFVFPGFIDTHTHIGFAGIDDEIATETKGAVVGGITTCLIYYRQLEVYGENLKSFIQQGAASAYVDFGVHLGMLIDDHLAQVREINRELGISSFKMYTCYKDGELAPFGVRGEDDGFMVDAFRILAEIPNSVVNVHSENDDVYLRRLQTLKAGKVSGTPLQQWSWTRPPFGEAEAISRVAMFARLANARVFIPHVGSQAALEACVKARSEGTKLHFETCPHYLLLNAEGEGHVQYAKVNPPVREESDRLAMLQALREGIVDTVGTDHATIPLDGKVGKSVWSARPGFPGLDTMVPALMDLVTSGVLAPEALARATDRSARLFSLTNKGRIEVGLDADLTICDPHVTRKIVAEELASWSDLSVFEGMSMTGWPSFTILRGRVVAEAGNLVGEHSGRYVERR
jgi:dihydroorotase (multifunctional complex type)